MRLVLTPTSPYARKAYIALLEKGVAFEPVLVQLADPALAELNPLGKVPTLVRDDGRPLYDSPVILQYLERFDPKLFPADPDARVEALRWEALCDGVCDAVVAVVMERRRAAPDATAMASQEAKARRGLARMEADVAGVVGFSAIDVAIAAAYGYVGLRVPSLLDGLPGLARHYARLMERESVRRTAPPA